MTEISVSQEIDAAPAVVWSICTSMDDWVETISAIEKVERLDGGTGFEVGTKWRETRTMFGKEATEEMEITELEDGRRYATFAESHGAKYYSEILVEPLGEDRTKLTMGFRGEPQSMGAKIMNATVGRLFVGATKKAIQADLVDIGKVAEGAD